MRHNPIHALHCCQRVHNHAAIATARRKHGSIQLDLCDDVCVAVEHGKGCTGRCIPHTYGRVGAARRHIHAVKGYRIYLQLVAFQHMQATAGSPVPKPTRKVVATTGHHVALHRQASHRVLVPC